MRLLFTLVTLFLSFTSIHAVDTIPDTATTSPLPTELIDVGLLFDKFDPSLGTLTNIILTVTLTGFFDISLTNNAATSQNARGTTTVDVDVTASIFASPATVQVSGTTGLRTLAAGETQAFNDLPGNNEVTFNIVYNGATMSNFIAGAPGEEIRIRFDSLSGFAIQGGGGNIASTQNTEIQVAGSLKYSYTAPAVQGDPQFAGFQGQQFQFHGLPDTVFNLVSAPELQMNAQFVYIASGSCNYNETACFSHAGTYLGTVGVAIGDQTFTVVSGPHSKGLRVFVQNGGDRHPMVIGAQFSFTTAHGVMSISHPSISVVEIRTPNFVFNIVNSDSFVNLEASLLNTQLLHTGAKKHHIKHCKDTQEIEHSLYKHYPIKNYIHGLVGQTWRAVTFCDQPYQGVVGDYIASDLFANDYRYNYFNVTA